MKTSRLSALVLALCLLLTACSGGKASPSPSAPAGSLAPSEMHGPPTPEPSPSPKVVDPDASTLAERFAPPPGYTRAEAGEGTFTAYLRAMPLKPDGAAVLQHDGAAAGVSAAAVIDLSIGSGDRCQLTDALIMLRARFLYDAGRKSDICFYFSSGFPYDFTTYATGRRVMVDGNDVRWVAKEAAGDSVSDLDSYLYTLYSYSRAVSVKANDTRAASGIAPGTLFTNDGGAIIADLARNDETGETAVLLVRGGSPACKLYVAANTQSPDMSPWIPVSGGGGIYLGDTTFLVSDVREFIH